MNFSSDRQSVKKFQLLIYIFDREIFESIWYAGTDAESLTSVLRKLFVKLMHKTEYKANNLCSVTLLVE